MEVKGDLCHDLLKSKKGSLAFDENRDYAKWSEEVKEKLYSLLGMDLMEANSCPLSVDVESEEEKDGYTQIRFTFESEKGAVVPCYLLIPNDGKEKHPVAITLQGHSSGFHNSVGIVKYDGDADYQETRGKFAVQAVKRGYVALAIEQRAMGERKTAQGYGGGVVMCTHLAVKAMQLGRTLLGERVWDVSKAIDALSFFENRGLDLDKIVLTGNSGGGTATFYASTYDDRIKISAPSCSFCSYDTSIMSIFHCPCNYLPGAMRYFEMGDLACAIAPKKLVIIAGKEDKIFPIDGVRESYKTVEKIYKKAGVPENCRLVETPKAHWWCEDLVFDAIKEEAEKLGW